MEDDVDGCRLASTSGFRSELIDALRPGAGLQRLSTFEACGLLLQEAEGLGRLPRGLWPRALASPGGPGGFELGELCAVWLGRASLAMA